MSEQMSEQKSIAAVVRVVLREEILRGAHSVGDALPSSRTLAARFGINRNTANGVCRELAHDGLVRMRPHRPPVVISRGSGPTDASLQDRIRLALWPLLHEAWLLHLREEEIRSAVGQALQEFFECQAQPRILVAECNREDAARYAHDLTTALGFTVRPILLDELSNRVDAEFVVTPMFHLGEVQAALEERHDCAQGFLVAPIGEDLSKLIQRVTHGPVGVVVTNPMSGERLVSILGFYLQTPFLLAATRDPQNVARVVREAEVVTCGPRSRAAVDRAGGSGKAVIVRYRADPASLDLLRARVIQWQRGCSVSGASDPEIIVDHS